VLYVAMRFFEVEFARKRTTKDKEKKKYKTKPKQVSKAATAKTRNANVHSPSESITRHVSVLSPSFSRALCARVRSGSNQSERQEKRISTVGKNIKELGRRARASASRRCERKNIQKTTLDAPPTSVCSASPSLSPVRSIGSSRGMMEYIV
jgi:hypothetical protein